MDRTPGTRTGSALITFERVVDLGEFDGLEAPGSARSEPGIGIVSSPSQTETSAHEAVRVKKGRGSKRKRKRIRPLLVLGIMLMLLGVGVLAQAAYDYWRHDVAVSNSQARLSSDFAERLTEEAPPVSPPAEVATTLPVVEAPPALFDGGDDIPVLLGPADFAPATPPVFENPADWAYEVPPDAGEPVGRILIPSLDLDWVVVEGVTASSLRNGPGHMPNTAMPGQLGNAVVSGHRTTYGKPFRHIDQLSPGDQIHVETLVGIHTYEVVSTEIVAPRDMWVTTQWDGSWLTLTTCNPVGSSRERLIVFSKLVDGPNSAAIESIGPIYEAPQPPD